MSTRALRLGLWRCVHSESWHGEFPSLRHRETLTDLWDDMWRGRINNNPSVGLFGWLRMCGLNKNCENVLSDGFVRV